MMYGQTPRDRLRELLDRAQLQIDGQIPDKPEFNYSYNQPVKLIELVIMPVVVAALRDLAQAEAAWHSIPAPAPVATVTEEPRES